MCLTQLLSETKAKPEYYTKLENIKAENRLTLISSKCCMECPINAKELHYTYLGQEREYLSLYQISPTEVPCTVQCISKSNFKTLNFSSLK